jgi:shikimate kinase
MGTGKTRVGRLVARRLGRPFVDFDRELEARFGRPIPRVFAEEGEAAFRAAEAELCRSLPARAGLVVATGGGAVVSAANREALVARGVLVCLTCRPDALLPRLQGRAAARRPLLGPDPAAAIRDLLERRAEHYAAAPYHVDTTARTPSAVATAVIGVYRAATKE